jgi:hypothetical protein
MNARWYSSLGLRPGSCFYKLRNWNISYYRAVTESEEYYSLSLIPEVFWSLSMLKVRTESRPYCLGHTKDYTLHWISYSRFPFVLFRLKRCESRPGSWWIKQSRFHVLVSDGSRTTFPKLVFHWLKWDNEKCPAHVTVSKHTLVTNKPR